MAPARRRNAPTWRDRIDRIGRVLEGKARGLRVVDGGGRVLAPGFIDLYTLAIR